MRLAFLTEVFASKQANPAKQFCPVRASRPQERREYNIDSLESRTLLSAVTSPILLEKHGVVAALGVTAVSNTITAGLDSTGTMVNVTVTPAGGSAVSQSFALSSVKRVILEGGAQADTIGIDQTNGPFTPITIILGHAGNDTIATGSERDLILGGDGNDTINSGEGNDSILGGKGDDSITTGAGNDLVFGGDGNDQVFLGGGHDTVFGLAGSDTLHGGDGADVFNAGGHDSLIGGAGGDTFYIAQSGHDTVTGGAGADQTVEVNAKTLHRRLEAAVATLHLDRRLSIEV